MISRPVTDAQRAKFLELLDDASFEVTEWESKFIESNLDVYFFTPGQRGVIDKLWETYGSRMHD